METPLVNPIVLKWAREKNGFTIQQASKKCGVTESTYLSWEEGKVEIPIRKLPVFAKVFKYTSAIFLLDVIPEEKYPIEFRNFFITYGNIGRELNLAIRSAQYVQSILKELSEYSDNKFVKRISELGEKSKKFEEISTILEEYLNLNYSLLHGQRDQFKVFKRWKEYVESQGISVMERGFPQNEARGFLLYDEIAPVIVLNTKDSIHSKIFSLIHELAHVVYRQSSIDNEITLTENKKGEIETLCNQIASEILVPPTILEERIISVQSSPLEVVISDLSKYFCVSREVIAYKLLDLKYYTRSVIEQYIEEVRQESLLFKSKKNNGGDYYKNVIVNNSPLYLFTVFDGLNNNKITFGEVVSILKVKSENITKLERVLLDYYE
ncbi:MAG TPA: XRE family transcriptional regulator [Candidatus Dojkabacteria bacterium]|nr:XRE family transcriptional regulator [Candidatus Dojkabacteria bacterium]